MNEEIEYYDNRLEEMYLRVENVSDLVEGLRDSRERSQRDTERYGKLGKELENKEFVEENENLRCSGAGHTKKLSGFQACRARRNMALSFPGRIQDMSGSIPLEQSEESSKTDLKSDPNIELFLKQISELKDLCNVQGEALAKFQEIMEMTKGDNVKLQTVLAELENDKRGLSDILINSVGRSSVFDCLGASPVDSRSMDSSMFISTLDGIEDKKESSVRRRDNLLEFSRKRKSLLEVAMIKSYIYGLKI